MPRIPSARIATAFDADAVPAGPLPRELVVATVAPRTPRLRDADWIRIDGGQRVIDVPGICERQAPIPVLFDIPGAQSPRRRNLLTTTESLVFAASQELAWVNLRDLDDPRDLDRARDFLAPDCPLSCTISDPSVLRRELSGVCDNADRLLLDVARLVATLPAEVVEDFLLAVTRFATGRGTAVFLTTSLRFSPMTRAQRASAGPGLLGRLLREGASGLVLEADPGPNLHAQESVDVARGLLEQVRSVGVPPDPAARKTPGARRIDS